MSWEVIFVPQIVMIACWFILACAQRNREGKQRRPMKRTTIFASEGGILMMVREHLSKAPSGNAAQRKKQVKHGWKPEWVREGRPMPYCLPVLGSNISLAPQFPNGVPAEETPYGVEYTEAGAGS